MLSPILTKLSEIAVLMSTVISPSLVKIGLKTKFFYHYAKFCRDPFLSFNNSKISKRSAFAEISAPNKVVKLRYPIGSLASRIYCLFDNMDKTLGKSNQSVINSWDSLSMKIVCKQNCIFQSVSTLFILLYTFLLPSLSI